MSRIPAENNIYPDFPTANTAEEQLLGPKITELLSYKPTTDPEAKLATDPHAEYTTVQEGSDKKTIL